jgi:hypothetical protein
LDTRAAEDFLGRANAHVQESSAYASALLAIERSCFCKEIIMNRLFSPFLADYIWIGGGTLGLIVVVVLIVLLLRK